MVELAARLNGVCDLGWPVDEQQIARRLGDDGHDAVGDRVVLNAGEKARSHGSCGRLVTM
jgi:hypothetical protein